MKIPHPKTNVRRTFLAKLCFAFMTDNIAIELRFRQQVAAEALRNIRKRANAPFFGIREGRTIWIVDAHDYGKRFVVRADEKLTAFVELEAIRLVGNLC
jgi:hypothetical protein